MSQKMIYIGDINSNEESNDEDDNGYDDKEEEFANATNALNRQKTCIAQYTLSFG